VEVRDHDPGDLDAVERRFHRAAAAGSPSPVVDEASSRPSPAAGRRCTWSIPSGSGKVRRRNPPGSSCIFEIQLDEHTFYTARMRVDYREEPCKSLLNRVKGMGFACR